MVFFHTRKNITYVCDVTEHMVYMFLQNDWPSLGAFAVHPDRWDDAIADIHNVSVRMF